MPPFFLYKFAPRRKLSRLKAARITNWTRELAIQYRLKATGKVIQTGIEMIGKMYMYLRKLRNKLDVLFWGVFMRLSRLMPPATNGRIPYGSGTVKSLNQRKPSVSMAGLICEL